MGSNPSTFNFFVNIRWNIRNKTPFLHEIFTQQLQVLLSFITSSFVTFSYKVIPLDEKVRKNKNIIFQMAFKAQPDLAQVYDLTH